MFNNDWKLLGVVKFGRNFVRDLGLIEKNVGGFR